MTSSTQRRLLVGAVALVPGKVRGSIEAATRARDEVDSLLGKEFFDGAPFKCVSVIIRYGKKTDSAPEFQVIENDELPIAIEVKMEDLRQARGDELVGIFRRTLVTALLGVAARYGTSSEGLQHAARS